ncbi:MAG: hypothetical protein R8P61_33830 [Bacteroidia bacterium]|nr:hypothetical protein [Bacteroidia bacterium]
MSDNTKKNSFFRKRSKPTATSSEAENKAFIPKTDPTGFETFAMNYANQICQNFGIKSRSK